jgi:HK97 gp10 family phage protein
MPALKMALRAMQAEVKSALKEASLAGAGPIHDEAESLAARSEYPTDVGHLADHIEVQVVKSTASSCLVRIGPDEDHWYGRMLETGAAAHTIKAKPGKLLRFTVNGQFVSTKEVQHPGMAAHPFLRPALDTKQNEALKAFAAVMKRRLT